MLSANIEYKVVNLNTKAATLFLIRTIDKKGINLAAKLAVASLVTSQVSGNSGFWGMFFHAYGVFVALCTLELDLGTYLYIRTCPKTESKAQEQYKFKHPLKVLS